VTPALPYAYVVVVSHHGPLTDRLLDGITDRSLGHLPFAATASLRWRSGDLRVAVIVFDGIDVLDSGVPWDATSGVLAYAGFPVPRAGWWAPGVNWAAQLRDALGQRPLAELAAEHFGTFTMAAIDDVGAGSVESDPLGVGVLYRADGPHRTAIASRASLAGIAALHPGRLERSADALAWLLSFDSVIGDGTGYRDVRALPARTSVRLDPGGRIVEATRPLARPGADADPVGPLEAELHQRLAVLAAAPERPWVGLTGGRDSRLLLAALVAAGLTDRFRFLTWDLGGGDVGMATRLARRYHLDHHVVAPDPQLPLRRALAAAVWRSEGMLPATEVGQVMGADEIFVSGIGGGLLGAQYGADRAVDELADADAALVAPVRRRVGASIATDDLVEAQTAALRELVATLHGDGWRADQILSIAFVDQRVHRWQGTACEVGPRPEVAPLLGPETMVASLATAHDDRRAFRWHDRLTGRACAGLLGEPFTTGGPSIWLRASAWPRIARLVREELLTDPTSALFDLIDFHAVELHASSLDPPSPHIATQLLNALGIARWLSTDPPDC
jgi:hypothetical protein